jgi:5-methylcytosine-specific restriction protein A
MTGEEGKNSIEITKEQWVALLEDRNIIREKDINLLKLFFGFYDCEATASQLAEQLHMSHHGPINERAASMGERIVNKLKISAPKRTDGSSMWWNVPFDGEPEGRGFSWKLRPELQAAMLEIYGEEELAPEIPSAEEVDVDSQEDFYEGAIKQVYVNRYERNRGARDKCVEHYGSKCIICGFDFEEKYGEAGKDVIHVHHLTPLSQLREKRKVDPIDDLRPVCANCHMIIHKGNPLYSIEEVKAMIRN